MAEKTKQHFVPQFYLKNFAINKKFNIYNIKRGLIENVPYGSQCYKNNFYGKDKIYETQLSILEGKWATSIKNIITNPKNISTSDAESIKEFCCFQYLRTESAYIHTQNILYDITSRTMPIIAQFHNLKVNDEDIKRYAYNYVKQKEDPEKTMKRQIDNAIKLSPIFNNLKLVILKNDTNIDFITSDNPIIIGNEFQTENGLGLDCIGFYCLCPISPRHYIALVDYKIYYKFKSKESININETMVRKINLIQFKNSLSNIFFKDVKTFCNLKEDLDYYEKAQKGKLLEEYNDKHNNFLSNNAKLAANQLFFEIIENTSNNPLISFLSKNLIENITIELFDVDEKAQPFKNQLIYNFHRSATREKVDERIAFMKFCNSDNVMNTIKHSVSKKQQQLVCKFENFLYDYFGLKKTTN